MPSPISLCDTAMQPAGFLSARALLGRYGLQAKKSWGQNFLVDERTFAAIIGATAAGPGDVVVEIGAGLGTLTHRLLGTGAQVFAVERERDMCHVLQQELGGFPKFSLLAQNALTLDLEALCAQQKQPLLLVGNLPYNIASPLLFRFSQSRAGLRRAVVMVQREMGERLLAQPGSRQSNSLGLQIQMFWHLRKVCPVGAGAFVPPPRVDSMVVSMTPRPGPAFPLRCAETFASVVRAAFSQRRKTLRNALFAAYAKDASLGALSQVGIDPGRRAETLSLSEWAALSDALVGVLQARSDGLR